MKRIVERCAGLDVHKASITACVRTAGEGGEPHQEVRKFSATTRGLLQLRDWLASFAVTLVSMEATGVYWKPVYYMLEDDFELWLLNARHLKGKCLAERRVRTVERVRKRLVEEGPQAAICERPRPGKAPKLDGRQEAYLVALACSDPPEEAASKRWSMRLLLAERLVELEVVDEISEETVRRTLKKMT